MQKTLIAATAVAAFPFTATAQVEQGEANADFQPAFENQTRAPELEGPDVSYEMVTDGLDAPWGIAELPSGAFLVTERPGRLRMMEADGSLSDAISGTPEVAAVNQGGLLDVAVDDNFDENREVWLTYAKEIPGGYVTAAGYGILSEDGTELTDWTEIFEQAPASSVPMHFGSRIAFEPGSDNVIITTGEHSAPAERVKAQDLDTHYGKVIRVDREGVAPADNPFVGEMGLDQIWSYGHRNIQSAAYDADDTLWIVEHGPAGGDELNQPEAGLNYGWPVISYGIGYNGNPIGTGEAVQDGMEQPVYYWDPVIAPGGMEFYSGDVFPEYEGDLLIGGLVKAAVVRLSLDDGEVTGEEWLAPGVGRVRDVEVTSDGDVLVLIDAPDPDGAVMRLVRDE
ncbi:MAG: PQQ-dependent sugar dehydrogenase [Loktanella sp.]|nr:PQQ-dependent sugar dehydrogenase [Loktanella sp.]